MKIKDLPKYDKVEMYWGDRIWDVIVNVKKFDKRIFERVMESL